MDIWERGQTFPPHMLSSFKEKLNAPKAQSKKPSPLGMDSFFVFSACLLSGKSMLET